MGREKKGIGNRKRLVQMWTGGAERKVIDRKGGGVEKGRGAWYRSGREEVCSWVC